MAPKKKTKKTESAVSKKQLKLALEDMIEVMGLTDWDEDDPMNEVEGDITKLNEKQLEKQIVFCSDAISEDDEFSPATLTVFSALDIEMPEKKEKPAKKAEEEPAKKGKAKKEPEPEPKEEEAKKDKKKVVKKEDRPEAKAGEKAREKKNKGPGVIATIISLLENGPITKEDMLKKLVAAFPDREEKAMKSTLNIQVPGRLTKDKELDVVEVKDKGWKIK